MPSAIAAYQRFAYADISIDPVAVKKFGISLKGVTCYCPEARLQLGAKNLDPRIRQASGDDCSMCVE
ncbi:MAG: hypothetical protein JO189_24065 [Deltaproteobacteria bacterium]|nr:hypothetical protein [Deltaproteobacteria bacterium]